MCNCLPKMIIAEMISIEYIALLWIVICAIQAFYNKIQDDVEKKNRDKDIITELQKEINSKDFAITNLKNIIEKNKMTYKEQQEIINKLLDELRYKNNIIMNLVSIKEKVV